MLTLKEKVMLVKVGGQKWISFLSSCEDRIGVSTGQVQRAACAGTKHRPLAGGVSVGGAVEDVHQWAVVNTSSYS